jgi:hypothetical protein
MRPTIGSLLEPHYKQNLYANPKRTAKFVTPRPFLESAGQNSFKNFAQRTTFYPGEPSLLRLTQHRFGAAGCQGTQDVFLNQRIFPNQRRRWQAAKNLRKA